LVLPGGHLNPLPFPMLNCPISRICGRPAIIHLRLSQKPGLGASFARE